MDIIKLNQEISDQVYDKKFDDQIDGQLGQLERYHNAMD